MIQKVKFYWNLNTKKRERKIIVLENKTEILFIGLIAIHIVQNYEWFVIEIHTRYFKDSQTLISYSAFSKNEERSHNINLETFFYLLYLLYRIYYKIYLKTSCNSIKNLNCYNSESNNFQSKNKRSLEACNLAL